MHLLGVVSRYCYLHLLLGAPDIREPRWMVDKLMTARNEEMPRQSLKGYALEHLPLGILGGMAPI